MVRVQWHTGMRPGEVTAMRTIDLDMSGKVWFYRPGSDRGPAGQHKMAYRGQQRIVPIGPKGQAVLKPWLRLNLTEYLFQPIEARAHFYGQRRANRKSPMTPSQAKRRPKAKPKRVPGERYTVASYDRAIRNACMRGDLPRWHPNQLRHAKATELRREAGLDATRAVLGHRTPVVTEIYAELDTAQAAAVMERLG
jgi:integrase